MKHAPPHSFDRFIGVDWSGARGPRLPRLQVAEALAGETKPNLIPCPDGKYYSRDAFVEDVTYARYFQGGELFERRLRITDQRCHQSGLGRPESIFRLVGPAQVAKGSLAGMRVLHHLRGKLNNLSIWPFDEMPLSRSVEAVVDIYPGAFVKMSGVAKGKVRCTNTLNRVLAYFGFAPVHEKVLEGGAVGDKADALIAAAALRHLSSDGTVWTPEELAEAQLWQEGWIFGIQ